MNAMVPEAKASVLNSWVAGILLRFQINKDGIASPWLWTEEHVPRQEQPARDRPQGTLFLEEKEVGLDRFLDDLVEHEFVLADMIGIKMPQEQKPFGRISFFFKRRADPEFAEHAKERIFPALRRLADSALWSVTVTRNRDIDGVKGRDGFFLRIDERMPLRYPNGTPITRRRKDRNGKSMGSPQPLRPEKFLRISAGRILIE